MNYKTHNQKYQNKQTMLTLEDSRALDLIEARIQNIERQILGNVESTENSTPVADSLINTNTLIATALSGREKITAVMKRLDELDKLLDPAAEGIMDTEAKAEEILAMEPDLEQNAKSMNHLEELLPVLDRKEIEVVPQLTEQLEKLTLFHLEKKEQAEDQYSQVLDLLQQYNAIVMNLTQSFTQWEEAVTRCEIAAQPKKVVE